MLAMLLDARPRGPGKPPQGQIRLLARSVPRRVRVSRCTASRNYRRYDRTASSGSVVANDPVNGTDPSGEACDSQDRSGCGAAQGAAARAATVGIGSDRARSGYEQRVKGLAPNDSAGRAAAKADARAGTPREVRAVIEARRPGLGPTAGSGGRANISNAGVNQTARTLGAIGKGAAVVGVAVAAVDIATSDNPVRATVANVGAAIGGVLGGAGGAALGTLGGPAAPVTVPAGGVAGSVVGGTLGYRAGEAIYDALSGN